ncbi:MAG: alpha/beta hydrolase [Burkholderiaceae bacterium]
MNEQTLIFGPDKHLVGTVTLPARALAGHSGTMALLTNAGVIPRMGPHRLNVKLARRFAERGIATLRFDLSGLGDSRRSSSRRSTGEQFIADTRCAMDLAQAKFAAERFFAVGFCSGGDVAHVTALEDDRLRAIVMWDSYVYATRQAKLRGLLHRLRRSSPRSAALKAAQWLAAAAKENDPSEVGQSSEGPKIFGRSTVPPRDEFGQRIRILVDRGVEMLFLYSGGEPLWYNYERQFHDMFASYGFVDRVAYEYLVRSDHTFIQPHAQANLIARVEHWLDERALPALLRARAKPAEIAASPSLVVA